MAEIYAFVTDEWAAKLPGVRAELAKTAAQGAARAAAILAAHKPGRDTKVGPSRIELEHGSLDWFVVLVDEAAGPIEFGRENEGGSRGTSSGIHAIRSAF